MGRQVLSRRRTVGGARQHASRLLRPGRGSRLGSSGRISEGRDAAADAAGAAADRRRGASEEEIIPDSRFPGDVKGA